MDNNLHQNFVIIRVNKFKDSNRGPTFFVDIYLHDVPNRHSEPSIGLELLPESSSDTKYGWATTSIR